MFVQNLVTLFQSLFGANSKEVVTGKNVTFELTYFPVYKRPLSFNFKQKFLE